MKTTELLKWFKLNYPHIVSKLRDCEHDIVTGKQIGRAHV